MAGSKENLKALFTNTRTRVIIVFTALLLIIATIIGVIKFTRGVPVEVAPTAAVTAAPSIPSIPGAINQTPQYIKLQEQQNLAQAEEAAKTGGSAIPTIIRTQAITEGMEVVGPKGGESGVGFISLTAASEQGAQHSLWLQNLKDANCSKDVVNKVVTQGVTLKEVASVCPCSKLKEFGYRLNELEPVCTCVQLKEAGFTANDLKNVGYSASRLRDCGFIACEMKAAGFTAQELMDAGYSAGELKGAGFTDAAIAQASGLPGNMTADMVRQAGCDPDKLAQLRKSGVSAAAIKRISGCSAEDLKKAGYTAAELKNAGFTAAELKRAGFTPQQLKQAGFSAKDLLKAGFKPEELLKAGFTQEQLNTALTPEEAAILKQLTDCSPETLRKARAAGISARSIREYLGCSIKDLVNAGYTPQELKDAGYTAADLKNAGFTAADLKNAGFDPKALKDAGYSMDELKNAGVTAKNLKDAGFKAGDLKKAGFNAKDLKDAGFTAQELKDAGFMPEDLKNAGYTAAELKSAGFTPAQLKNAGYTVAQLKDAGLTAKELSDAGFAPQALLDGGFTQQQLAEAGIRIPGTAVGALPAGAPGAPSAVVGAPAATATQQALAAINAVRPEAQMEKILEDQAKRAAEQQYQQNIDDRTSQMLTAANQYIQNWSQVDTQVYEAGTNVEEKAAATPAGTTIPSIAGTQVPGPGQQPPRQPIIKAGDIMYGVIETSVNSDEPSPILATIVSGKLRGTRLIGSFNLQPNAEKMIITFNTMSVPGAPSTTAINAYAIDPDTARTALSSRTDHHYLMRYGSLFASSFMEGLGNAIQTANTTITIGGTGGLTNTIVQNSRPGGVTLENAVIALTAVGKAWGQQAQQIFNRPTTVEVYAGTAIGILFTQDLINI